MSAPGEKIPCSNCGRPLPVRPFERSVTCEFCKTGQPNRGCVRAGDEVLIPHQAFPRQYELGRVTACEGPDAIDVEVGAARHRRRLEELTPVADGRDVAFEPGLSVFARGPVGWERTRVASVGRGGQVVVKHPGPMFQRAFFDRPVDASMVRVHADPQQRERRTLTLGTRLFGGPVDTFFALMQVFYWLNVFVMVALFVAVIGYLGYIVFGHEP